MLFVLIIPYQRYDDAMPTDIAEWNTHDDDTDRNISLQWVRHERIVILL